MLKKVRHRFDPSSILKHWDERQHMKKYKKQDGKQTDLSHL
jgi:hypothetical protein